MKMLCILVISLLFTYVSANKCIAEVLANQIHCPPGPKPPASTTTPEPLIIEMKLMALSKLITPDATEFDESIDKWDKCKSIIQHKILIYQVNDTFFGPFGTSTLGHYVCKLLGEESCASLTTKVTFEGGNTTSGFKRNGAKFDMTKIDCQNEKLYTTTTTTTTTTKTTITTTTTPKPKPKPNSGLK